MWERTDGRIRWFIGLPWSCAPRGQTFEMTKWSSDTLSGVPGGWKRLSRNPNSCSGAEGTKGTEEMRGCGKGGWLMLLSDPLSPFFSHLSPFLLHFYFALPHRLTLSLSVGQPICSGKPGPLSPVSGYWHSRYRLGGEGSANRALRVFWHYKTLPDNCTFDLLECWMQEQLKSNWCNTLDQR